MLYLPPTRGALRGFSLVEVVLALGVMAFALLALVGMLGVGFSTSKDSVADTRTTAIASQVFEKARAELCGIGAFASPVAPWQGNPPYRDYWFDEQGVETTNDVLKLYRARALLVNPLAANLPAGTSATNLKALTIEVASPVVGGILTPNTNAIQKRNFSLLLRNQANKGAYP